MEEKLKQGKYHDRFVFEQDFRLMISNAKLYNMSGSYAHNQAVGLEKFFNDCMSSGPVWKLLADYL